MFFFLLLHFYYVLFSLDLSFEGLLVATVYLFFDGFLLVVKAVEAANATGLYVVGWVTEAKAQSLLALIAHSAIVPSVLGDLVHLLNSHVYRLTESIHVGSLTLLNLLVGMSTMLFNRKPGIITRAHTTKCLVWNASVLLLYAPLIFTIVCVRSIVVSLVNLVVGLLVIHVEDLDKLWKLSPVYLILTHHNNLFGNMC